MRNFLMFMLAAMFCLPLMAQSTTNDDILRRAEVMPVFKVCEDARFANHPYRCTITQLMAHFDSSIQASSPAGKQTKAHLKFVVEKDGTVSNIDLVRGVVTDDTAITEELNTGILSVANNLVFQSAATQDGEPVRVQIEFSVALSY